RRRRGRGRRVIGGSGAGGRAAPRCAVERRRGGCRDGARRSPVRRGGTAVGGRRGGRTIVPVRRTLRRPVGRVGPVAVGTGRRRPAGRFVERHRVVHPVVAGRGLRVGGSGLRQR